MFTEIRLKGSLFPISCTKKNTHHERYVFASPVLGNFDCVSGRPLLLPHPKYSDEVNSHWTKKKSRVAV